MYSWCTSFRKKEIKKMLSMNNCMELCLLTLRKVQHLLLIRKKEKPPAGQSHEHVARLWSPPSAWPAPLEKCRIYSIIYRKPRGRSKNRRSGRRSRSPQNTCRRSRDEGAQRRKGRESSDEERDEVGRRGEGREFSKRVGEEVEKRMRACIRSRDI